MAEPPDRVNTVLFDLDDTLLALNKLGSNAEETLMVGDSAADIQAAHNAGCRSCYATWGLLAGLPEDLKAHYTVKAPRDLLVLDCFSLT